MKAIRGFSLAALVVACTHLVFGAIVRISGSGMGCGDNWPKCYGYWFPPFKYPSLVVEVSHRYLASILTLTVLSLAFVAFRKRNEPGVSGPGGPLRSSLAAVGAVFTAAVLGGVTVKTGNPAWATVAHWLVAMTLLATVAATAIRAGTLGGTSVMVERASQRAAQSGGAAAALALITVALGGLTAKVPGASFACRSFPFCDAPPGVPQSVQYVQLAHRLAAILLAFHVVGMAAMFYKRRDEEPAVILRAGYLALLFVLAQIGLGVYMVTHQLPPVVRSVHEATGVAIWLTCFALAYLGQRSNGSSWTLLADGSFGPDGQLHMPPGMIDPGASRGPDIGSVGGGPSFRGERQTGDASIVAAPPSNAAPSLSTAEPQPKPAPTMAVIVARGADML